MHHLYHILSFPHLVGVEAETGHSCFDFTFTVSTARSQSCHITGMRLATGACHTRVLHAKQGGKLTVSPFSRRTVRAGFHPTQRNRCKSEPLTHSLQRLDGLDIHLPRVASCKYSRIPSWSVM
jgi:hypothetical protein